MRSLTLCIGLLAFAFFTGGCITQTIRIETTTSESSGYTLNEVDETKEPVKKSMPESEDPCSILRVYRANKRILPPPAIGEDVEDNVGPYISQGMDDGGLAMAPVIDGSQPQVTLRYFIINCGDEPVRISTRNADDSGCTVDCSYPPDMTIPVGAVALVVARVKPDGSGGSSWSFDVDLTNEDSGQQQTWKVTGGWPTDK